MSRRPVLSVCLAAAVLVAPLYVEAERARTPEARSFAVREDDAEHRIIGIVEVVPGTEEWVGFVVRCVKATGALEGSMAFGFFPPGKRVQAAVRAPSGRVERFGPVVVGGRGAGFHDPEVVGRSDVLRLMNAAMAEGALISNGHNSVWNRIPDAENARARALLSDCTNGNR
ncbi:MAG: hypothetical protein OXH14_11945 [Alphaproteobacteria bacterium]|nr:hypothetical protein [Alphaproteobacteria bacterium]